MTEPLVTIAFPSFNQGSFLDKALASIVEQDIPVDVVRKYHGSVSLKWLIAQPYAVWYKSIKG